MGALFTDVATHRLPTIPHLTTVSVDFHETRNGTIRIDAHYTRPSGSLRKTGPTLVTDVMYRTKTIKSVVDIMLRRIKRKIVNNNINPIRGRRRGTAAT